MKKNKVTTYLLYAVGEITLVVIGILIAVSLNNWNAERKNRQYINRLVANLQGELTQNVLEANSFIANGYEIEKSLQEYIEIDDPANIQDIPRYLLNFGTSTQRFIDNNLLEIIEAENKLPESYLPLIPKLKELKRRIDSRKLWEERELHLSGERTKEMIDQFEWYFGNDAASVGQANAYYASTLHKNKVIQYYAIRLSENTYDASLIRTSSIVLLWEIAQLKNQEDTILDFLRKLGLNPLNQINCSDPNNTSFENQAGFRRNFVIYNDTDADITLEERIKNDSTHSAQLLIPSKGFFMDEFYLFQNEYLLLNKANGCNTIYYHEAGDFIVIHDGEPSTY